MGDITSNLKCRFALDEASGATCYDAGSEGIDATINGAAKRIVYPAGVAKLAGNTLTIDGVLQ